MALILFIITIDSLPPLPDLTEVIFPEPVLWIGKNKNSIRFNGLIGDFYGANFGLIFQNLKLALDYQRLNDWHLHNQSTSEISYALATSHFWLEPICQTFFINKVDNYKTISPSLNTALTTPSFILMGRSEFDLWEINSLKHFEEKSELTMLFDQLWFLPLLGFTNTYTNRTIKNKISFKVHIQKLHLGITLPLNKIALAPHFNLEFIGSKFNIIASIKSGSEYPTLKEQFDPSLPFKYRMVIPEESLRVGLDLKTQFEFTNHSAAINFCYNNWYDRIVGDKNYEINTWHDIQELIVKLQAVNNLQFTYITFKNQINIKHCLSDTTIPFVATNTVTDSLNIDFWLIRLFSEGNYLSSRKGIETELKPLFTINLGLGLILKNFLLYTQLTNLTNQTQEIFDHYFLTGRQYAGGIKFKHSF